MELQVASHVPRPLTLTLSRGERGPMQLAQAIQRLAHLPHAVLIGRAILGFGRRLIDAEAHIGI